MYFIEYTKHELIICCNGSDDMSCYINLVINKYDGMYVFFFSLYIQKNICIMVLNK